MKKNRYIPFGYTMNNGKIVLHKQEAPAVQMIFGHYLMGESLQSIAQVLASHGPTYNEGKVWNKNMIKRILEDTRYLGEAEYPPLVSIEDFSQVSQTKSDRNTSTPLPTSTAVDVLIRKLVCGECGVQYQRRADSRDGERWRCKNISCKTVHKITDQYLLDTVVRILNQAIETSSLLEQPEHLPHSPNLEITRLENEIGREMDRAEIDGDAVKVLLFSCAAAKYTAIRKEMPSMHTLFSDRAPMVELDATFFEQTVEQLAVARDGSITLRIAGGIQLALYEPTTDTRST